MKKYLLIIALAFLSQLSWGQAYSTGIGFKGGYPGYGGLNLKHDFGGVFGDFTIGGSNNYLSLSAIAEKQQTLEGNLDWYVGVGAYLNSWRNSYYYKDKYYDHGAAVGAVGVLGIEYTFDELPINIGLDAGPAVNIVPYFGVGFGGNIAIRYVIN